MREYPRLAYSIAEAARIAGIGKSTFYADVANKHVPIRKMGRRSLVLHADLIAWLNTLPSEAKTVLADDEQHSN